MSITTDYAQPRRIDWEMMLTRLCGVCAFLSVGAADDLSQRLYELFACGVVW